MLIDGLFTLIGNAIAALLNLMPNTGAFPLNLSAAGTLVGVFKAFDGVFPVSVLMGAIAFGITLRVALGSTRVGLWVYEHLPFVGG